MRKGRHLFLPLLMAIVLLGFPGNAHALLFMDTWGYNNYDDVYNAFIGQSDNTTFDPRPIDPLGIGSAGLEFARLTKEDFRPTSSYDATHGFVDPDGPGYGGDPFDAAYLFAAFDDDAQEFFVSLVTGTPQAGAADPWYPAPPPERQPIYLPGDFRLNVTNGGIHEYAIATRTRGTINEGGFLGMNGDPNNWDGVIFFPSTDPWAVKDGAYDSQTALGAGGFAYSGFGTALFGIQQYVIEMIIPYAQLGISSGGEIDSYALHWTIECGNDEINQGGTPPPLTTVPEPTTLLLLGIGLSGLAGRARRRLVMR